MKVAYADPPYPGQAHLYREHPDYGGEVDHPDLIASLVAGYDAWILHTNSTTLKQVLPHCPEGVRIGSWVKTFASFKTNVSIAYAWEPVIFHGGRLRARGLPTLVDYVLAPITLQKGCAGAKPPIVCRWAFDMLGLTPDDDLTDLFPGSGAVQEAWDAWTLAPTLPLIDYAGRGKLAETTAPIEGVQA